MSVTTYEIGCNYRHPKLKNKVYFLSKSFFNPSTNEVTVSIDSGDASVSIVTHVPHPTPPNVIEGFGIKFTETESLDERYRFTKQLNISINGHLTDTTWLLENDYYIMVETIEGTFYLINVDFPSEMSFTYNLSNSQDQTDFVFTSNSNFPTLKVNSVPWESFNTCKTYNVPGVDYLKLLEKDYVTIDVEDGVINLFDSHVFKNIDYLKNTISLSESYDGDIATTTISFEIPFDDYKTSWQYNLLEFKQNLYVAQIGSINDKTIFAGTEHGLEPSYEINGSTSDGEATSIKITLTEASNWGIFEYDTWTYYVVPERQFIGVQSEYVCLSFGVAGYTLMMEVDENNTPTGRYKCLASEYDRYMRDYNIIGTYEECERFKSPKCARYAARSRGETSLYTCINGDKYELIGDGISYDGGKTWNYDNLELGPMVESASTYCEITPEYKWELTNDYTCVEYIPPVFEGKYKLTLSDSSTVSAECDSSSAITSGNTASYKNTIVSAEIGNCVTGLTSNNYGEGVFQGCTALTSVTLGDNITTLGSFTFRDCTGLTSIDIPNSVTVISNNAFDTCTSLTGITIPSGVTVLNTSLFYGCTSLTSVTIPSGITSIGTWGTFYGCTGLASIICLPTTPPTLGTSVFDYTNDCPIYVPCESVNAYKTAWSTYASRIQCKEPVFNGKFKLTLNNSSTVSAECDSTSSVTSGEVSSQYSGSVVSAVIGDCVTSIGFTAFYHCGRLANIDIPDSVTSIGGLAFYFCRSLASIDIPDSVTSIGNHAFYYCTSLTSCTIGSGVTSIGHAAFGYCSGLTSVTIPDSITRIDYYSFEYCSGLTSVTIGSGVTFIGGNAFEDCSGLSSVTIKAVTPPTLGDNNVFNNTNNCPIYVPSGSVNAYKNAGGYWSNYVSRIQAIPT